MKRTDPLLWARNALLAVFLVAMVSGCVPYMKMSPPPDSDKPLPVPASDNSCWLHTAANMLAGAGYGNGATLQARANDIFADLSAQFCTANGGWTDTVLTWWLASANNTWPVNPYTVVTVYGNKSPRFPWANANGAQTIANELRNCNMVGLSISWPTDAPGQIGSGGHAITGWGDNNPSKAPLSARPGRVRVTDSDTDDGGDVQAYTYDAYTNPNPGGAKEGNDGTLTTIPTIPKSSTSSPFRRPTIPRITGSPSASSAPTRSTRPQRLPPLTCTIPSAQTSTS